MESSASNIHNRSSTLPQDTTVLQKQLQELTSLQIGELRDHDRQKSELNKKLLYPSTISDLEDMLLQDIVWDIPIEYYTQPHPMQHNRTNNRIVRPQRLPNPSGIPRTAQLHPLVNGTKRSGRCFEAIREQKLTASLPVLDQIDYTIYTFNKSFGGAHGPSIETATPVREMVPVYSDFIGTSDRFVAILNILKQNQDEVCELRRELIECKKNIHRLTSACARRVGVDDTEFPDGELDKPWKAQP